VQGYTLQPANAERGEAVVMLQPAELALDGSVSSVQVTARRWTTTPPRGQCCGRRAHNWSGVRIDSGEMSHGAAPPALGYAYQAEAALVALVRRAKVEPATKLASATSLLRPEGRDTASGSRR
jgi:hypothetical protein